MSVDRRKVFALALGCLLFAACSDDTETKVDAGRQDKGIKDATIKQDKSIDSAPAKEQGLEEGGVMDTGTSEGGVEEGGPGDGPLDVSSDVVTDTTSPGDTAPSDTTSPDDTTPADTTAPVDTTPADTTAPTDTTTPVDAPMGPFGLTATDQPAVGPCPNQDLLLDSAKLMQLKDALNNGAHTYLDVPWSGTDPDTYKKKCGLESYWNPAENTDEIPGTPMLDALLAMGHSGICADGFTHTSFGTPGATNNDYAFNGEGFPVAGTYRKEFKVAYQANTYHLRVRVTVSGTAAGKKFTELGYTTVGNLIGLTSFKVNTTYMTHNALWGGLVNNLSGTATTVPSATLYVEDNVSNVIYTAVVEVLCAATL